MLAVDANQRWDVGEAIEWMARLARFDPYWIEEPTSPDDILGHAAIARGVAPDPGRDRRARPQPGHVQAAPPGRARSAICQIDACRLGGVNEVLAVLLLAARFGVPGLPARRRRGPVRARPAPVARSTTSRVSGSLDGRMIEYVDHLHEHFLDPVVIRDGRYVLPSAARLQRRDGRGVAGAVPPIPDGAEWSAPRGRRSWPG